MSATEVGKNANVCPKKDAYTKETVNKHNECDLFHQIEPIATLEEKRPDLTKEIYLTLRKEVEYFLKEYSLLSIYATLATGAVWYYVLQDPTKIKVHEFLFIPVALAMLFAIKAHGVRWGIHIASDHLAGIEKAYGLDEKIGWDTRWRKQRIVKGRNYFGDVLGKWHYYFWGSIVLINLAVAGIIYWKLWTGTYDTPRFSPGVTAERGGTPRLR